MSRLTLLTLLSISTPYAFSANIEDKDSDSDGLTDLFEEKIGTEPYLSDTDGDGIKDGIEVGEDLNKPLDSDNDKRIDAVDYDDDNDGLPTFLESQKDTDKDGVKDYLDTDSDNDGLMDGKEAGALNQDKNLDGIDDAFDSARSGAIDKNGDGIDDNFKLPDHNNDGIADYVDAEYKKPVVVASKSPSNRITKGTLKKVIENKKTDIKATDIAKPPLIAAKNIPNKKEVVGNLKKKPELKIEVNRYTDSDNDGLLDSQERILGTNIMNRDSDGDKVSDAIEIGMDINSPLDSDHDGIIDALDHDDDNDGILTKNEDINKDNTAINDDTDQDGVPNYLDANDDGDNRLTKKEGETKDSDNDGIPDYLDKYDGVKHQAPKETLADEPEIVVLFDGNFSSLAKEDNDIAEQTIENAVSNDTLNNTNENFVDSSDSQNLKSKKVVISDIAITTTSDKKKSGIMQWLTSLLPD